jgi:hypothetical protein
MDQKPPTQRTRLSRAASSRYSGRLQFFGPNVIASGHIGVYQATNGATWNIPPSSKRSVLNDPETVKGTDKKTRLYFRRRGDLIGWGTDPIDTANTHTEWLRVRLPKLTYSSWRKSSFCMGPRSLRQNDTSGGRVLPKCGRRPAQK